MGFPWSNALLFTAAQVTSASGLRHLPSCTHHTAQRDDVIQPEGVSLTFDVPGIPGSVIPDGISWISWRWALVRVQVDLTDKEGGVNNTHSGMGFVCVKS